MKKLIIGILFLTGILFAQKLGSDDYNRLKDAYIQCTFLIYDLRHENAYYRELMDKIKQDLIKIKTIDQLDSLKLEYGLKK